MVIVIFCAFMIVYMYVSSKMCEPVLTLITDSLNQSIDQSIDQSVSQSINQSINQLIS